MDDSVLTKKDIEKLVYVRKSVNDGLACTINKNECILALDSVLEPKCCVCRQVIESNPIIINERKMHASCRSKYKG